MRISPSTLSLLAQHDDHLALKLSGIAVFGEVWSQGGALGFYPRPRATWPAGVR